MLLMIMNVEHFRRSLKTTWLRYYRDNRAWIARIGIWVDCEGQRRPSSSFILGTLSTLEPQLCHLLPLVVDLSSNPDRIVIALGLNFNPDKELEAIAESGEPLLDDLVKLLPSSQVESAPSSKPMAAIADEACQGVGRNSR